MLTKILRFRIGKVESQIRQRLTAAFTPMQLEVVNQSHMHSRGRESHFNVMIVSDKFKGLKKIEQHRLVHTQLGPLMKQIHGITVTCFGNLPDRTKNDSPGCVHEEVPKIQN